MPYSPDRDLLNMAAQAIASEVIGWEPCNGGEVAILADGARWQPLRENPVTDCMGDVMRLVVTLKLRLAVDDYYAEARHPETGEAAGETATMGYGIEEATRRAVVRVAAKLSGHFNHPWRG